MNENKNHSLGVMVKDARLPHGNASRVTEKAKNYMMLITDPDEINMTIAQLRNLPTWNPLAQVVILFTERMKTEEEKNDWVEQAFSELLTFGMLNVNVIYQNEGDKYTMLVDSWLPYHGKSCGRKVANMMTIDECTSTYTLTDEATDEWEYIGNITELHDLVEEPKIPEKDDFHGCTLNVTSFNWEPFVLFSPDGKTVESGLEVLMLQTIGHKMRLNMTFNLLPTERRTQLISDDNKTGIYTELLQK